MARNDGEGKRGVSPSPLASLSRGGDGKEEERDKDSIFALTIRLVLLLQSPDSFVKRDDSNAVKGGDEGTDKII